MPSNHEYAVTVNVNEITREKWILDTFPEWGTWLNEEIESTVVQPNTFAMWWLGCTGIWVKTPGGANFTVDFWVGRGKHTHNVPSQGPDFQMNRMCGARDLMPNTKNIPCVLDPFRIREIDAVFSTHFHNDHIDAYVAAAVMQNCPDAPFIGPQFSANRWMQWGVPAEKIKIVKPGDHFKFKDVEVYVVESFDRTALITAPPEGDITGQIFDMDERAVNYIFVTPGGSLYHSGDSHFCNYYRKHGKDFNIDVALGSYGLNPRGLTDKMTASDILRMAENLDCKVMIPYHYDLWSNMLADPADIDLLYEKNKYLLQFKFKPFIWQVGGKFVYPDDKDRRHYMYPRGMEDSYTHPIGVPYKSFL